jgi:hypothetical protein
MEYIAQFKAGQNPAGIACLYQKHGTQFVIMAPDLVALRALLKALDLGDLDAAKCKCAKLAADRTALFDPIFHAQP